MLTDTELHHPYLNLGAPVPVGMLAGYWSLVLERKVEVEEVHDAITRMQAEWCYHNPAKCQENRLRWERIVAENEAQHASGYTSWRGNR